MTLYNLLYLFSGKLLLKITCEVNKLYYDIYVDRDFENFFKENTQFNKAKVKCFKIDKDFFGITTLIVELYPKINEWD